MSPLTTANERRCTARLCFPATPYHNLRCARETHEHGSHTTNTTVPTMHAPESASDTANVTLTWDSEVTP